MIEHLVPAYMLTRSLSAEPLTLLNGIYATNFATPGTQAPWGFWAFAGIQVAFLILAVLLLRRRGLL